MKKTVALAALGFVLGIWRMGAIAAEHPTGTQAHEHPTEAKEHPTETKKEHPTEVKKEHPAKKEHASKEHPGNEANKKEFQNSYEKTVKDYIASEAAKTGGVYTVKDTDNTEWKLKLMKVHKSKICMLQEGKSCFACADFMVMGGKGKVDLDFYAKKSEGGQITMEKVLIHKVNGKPRFTYDANNNMVAVK